MVITMNLSVFSKQLLFELPNFWNNIHFHPTDAIEDEWGQRILNRVAEDNIAQTVRMYTMFEDIVTMDEAGNLKYDFSLNDERIDYMISKGFNLLLIYAYVPPCLAVDPSETSNVCKNKTRYKGKLILTSPPVSYDIWEKVCATYTAHIIERYGENTVSKWYLQCHNEPDIPEFWMKNEKDMSIRCREYCKLYDAFEAGIRSVSKKMQIGGPTLALNFDFLEQYLKYVKEKKRQIDFISFHTYGTTPEELNSGEKPFAVDNSIERIITVKEIANRCGFDNIPLVIDEWGASSAGFYNVEECPLLIFREKPAFAVYFIKMITLYIERRLPIAMLMICLSGQHEMITDFSGYRNFFTLNFYQKPIYNAYYLAGKLGNHYIAQNGNMNSNLSVLPTVDDNGRVTILLGYASHNFDQQLPPLTLNISIPDMEGRHAGELYRIDETHANAMYTYEKLGSPDKPTKEQMSEIRKSAIPVAEPIIFTDKKSFTITIENNSAILIYLE